MKPITENPFFKKNGQRKHRKMILVLYLVPILTMLLPISDGMAKSITESVSILSEEFKGNNSSGGGDISIALTGSSISLTSPSILVNENNMNAIQKNNSTESVKNNLEGKSTTGSAISVTPTKKPTKTYVFNKKKYIKAVNGLIVRSKPSKHSKKLTVYQFNTKIKCASYNKKWVIIKYKKNKNGTYKYGYLYKKYLSNKKCRYKLKGVSGDRRKSYMDWRCITSTGSPQYKLQRKARTASNGIRTVNGRYCVALGSYYTTKIGKYVDLVLANGTVIPCVIGDQKANCDTDSRNAIGVDGSCAEFIVTTSALSHKTRQMGDVGYAHKGWKSKVVKIKLYNKNAFYN